MIEDDLATDELEVIEDDLATGELEVIEDDLATGELEVIEDEPPQFSNATPCPINNRESMDCGIEEFNAEQQNHIQNFDVEEENENSPDLFN